MRGTSFVVAAILAATHLTAVAPACMAQDEYQSEIDEWHAGRVDRLRRSTGWLSLVGLHQLEEGSNRLGSAADNSTVLPDFAPARVGEIHVSDRGYRFVADDEAQVTVDGEAIREIELQHDQQPEPTLLTVGRLVFYVIERGRDAYLRVKDTENPLLKSFDGIDRWPVDPAWRIEARWEAYEPPKVIAIPDVLGNVNESPCPGVAIFEIDGTTYRLEPTGAPGEDLFLVFGDATNGEESYGGGRFLTVKAPADERVVLDFNRAYNPPCVFTPYATCPLPTLENRIDLAISAGEKVWGEHH